MKKLLVGLTALIVVFIVGTAVFLATVDVDKYRGQIADALGNQIGRTVKLEGPIKFAFTWHGVTLDIQNAGIGNPFWASRPMMAGIGRFNLGISLLPLFARQFVVTGLEIANADIDLETDRNGRHNWDMGPERQDASATTSDNVKARSGNPVSIQIARISIKDSQVTLHDKDGQASIFKISGMTLGTGGAGVALHLSGEYNDLPVTLSLNAGMRNLFSAGGSWPFDTNLTYADYTIKAKGSADMDKKQAVINSYEVTAGKSGMHGAIAANWGGVRPSLQGTLVSDHLDPADFKLNKENAKSAAEESSNEDANSRRLFSDKPLDLDILKSVDADFDIAIGEFVAGNKVLKQTTAKLRLSEGFLSLTPLRTMLGEGAIEGQIKLNGASSPPQLAVALTAPEIKLEDLLSLLNAPNFLSGKASANLNLASSGDSMHAMASNTVGVVDVVAAAGDVSSSAAGDIASGLMELFAPGGSNNLNCLVARFVVKNGVAHDNGILADTSATTVVGNGGFDLGRETIDIVLHAKSKQMDVGGLVPPLLISGTLFDPSFKIDPSETIGKVAGILNGGSLSSSAPEIITQPGQNACVYTLDHPSSATTSKSVLPDSLMGKVKSGLNNVSDALRGFLRQ